MEIDDRLPIEFMFLLKTVRVFGHFDKPVFLSLCKHMKVSELKQDEYLFNIGDKDEWIYVVQVRKIVFFGDIIKVDGFASHKNLNSAKNKTKATCSKVDF